MCITSLLTKQTLLADHVKNIIKENAKQTNEADYEYLEEKKLLFENMLADLNVLTTTATKLMKEISEKEEFCGKRLAELRKEEETMSELSRSLVANQSLLEILDTLPNQLKKVEVLMEVEDLLTQIEERKMATEPLLSETFITENLNMETNCMIKANMNTLVTLSTSLQRRLDGSLRKFNLKSHTEVNRVEQVDSSCDLHQESSSFCQITELKHVEGRRNPNRKRAVSETKLEHYKSLLARKEEDEIKTLAYQRDMSIKIRIEGDQHTCAITGLVEMLDGNLVMADFPNKTLKLFGSNSEVIDYHVFDKSPRDVALVDKEIVAVTIPEQKKIQLVKVIERGGKQVLSLDRQIDIGATCCGISVVDGYMYTATQRPTRILVLNINGEKIDDIVGDTTFERPTYVVYDKTFNRVYVSDANHKCIYGLNPQKEVEFRFAAEDPHGIALDEASNLFVADWNENVVHQVSTDGAVIAQLKLGGSECPQKLHYSTRRHCLYVTLWESNKLRVFFV